MESGAADPVVLVLEGLGPVCCGDVLQFWSLRLGRVLLCYRRHLGVRHLELWGFQGWRNFPPVKLSPAKLSPGEIFPPPVMAVVCSPTVTNCYQPPENLPGPAGGPPPHLRWGRALRNGLLHCLAAETCCAPRHGQRGRGSRAKPRTSREPIRGFVCQTWCCAKGLGGAARASLCGASDAASPELLHCTHSKARDFKEAGRNNDANWYVNYALQQRTGRASTCSSPLPLPPPHSLCVASIFQW